MTPKALVDSILAMRLKPDHPAQHDEPETSAGDRCESSASTGPAADVQPASADELAGESTSSVVHAEVHSKHNDQPNQQKQEAKHDLSADDSGNMEESLEDIPMDEMLADPMYLAKVSCGLFNGEVEHIEQGTVTKERLYRVLYDDGDMEHFTAEEAHNKLCILCTGQYTIAWH